MKTHIQLTTKIIAPVEICFDLSRSIDLHMTCTTQSNERAIAGRTSGLIEMNEMVTWEATHFFVRQKLTSRIVTLQRPDFFKDVMVKGAFKSMEHDHTFRTENSETIMTDDFIYEVPFGIAGTILDQLFLKRYMTNLLLARNRVIKQTAESEDWKRYILMAPVKKAGNKVNSA